MLVPDNIRRIFALIVPAMTALALFGILDGFAKLDENIASTGVTMKIILGVLNLILLFIIFKRRVP